MAAHIAEAPERLRSRLVGRQAALEVLLGRQLDVAAHLCFKVPQDPLAPKQASQPGNENVESFHQIPSLDCLSDFRDGQSEPVPAHLFDRKLITARLRQPVEPGTAGFEDEQAERALQEIRLRWSQTSPLNLCCLLITTRNSRYRVGREN